MSRDCCVAIPLGAIGLSAVCYYGISKSYSLFLSVIYVNSDGSGESANLNLA